MTDYLQADWIQANWLLLVVLLVLAVLLAWWLFGRTSRPAPRQHRPDVLDEGAAPATRNQALIDSPAAAAIVPPTMLGTPGSAIGGAGELIAGREQGPEPDAPLPNAEAMAWEATETSEPANAEPDDLRRLKGVGPKLVTALHALGVTRYAQIAAWSEADIDSIDARLGAFAGRIRRDDWVGQAHLLASGDTEAYEARFGKL